MAPATPTPLSRLTLLTHQIPAHALTPNTSLSHKPLLIYRAAFPPATPPAAIEAHLLATGAVVPQWRYTMYPTSHFHSTAHEVLCIAHGRARVCFGHVENPSHVEYTLQRGDVVVVPAGVAHNLLEDLDGRFLMIGSYPVGCAWDMCYGRAGEEAKVARIKGLAWFTRDPVYGDEGPVLDV